MLSKIGRNLIELLKITICVVLDTIKVFVWPIKSLWRAVFFTKIPSDIVIKLKILHSQGIMISELSSKFKTLEKRVNVLDTYEMPYQDIGNEQLSDRIKALEDKFKNEIEPIDKIHKEICSEIKWSKKDIKALEDASNKEIQAIKETMMINIGELHLKTDEIKALEDKVTTNKDEIFHEYGINSRLISLENTSVTHRSKLKALDKKVTKLQLDTSDLTFLPADDDCDKVFREEYDYHQEAKYWDKKSKEAYEDHMCEPQRRHDD